MGRWGRGAPFPFLSGWMLPLSRERDSAVTHTGTARCAQKTISHLLHSTVRPKLWSYYKLQLEATRLTPNCTIPSRGIPYFGNQIPPILIFPQLSFLSNASICLDNILLYMYLLCSAGLYVRHVNDCTANFQMPYKGKIEVRKDTSDLYFVQYLFSQLIRP